MARGNKTKYQDVLSQQDCELFERVLAAYEQRKVGTMRYKLSCVKQDSLIIINLVCFTGLPPWQWTEEYCSNWGLHLAGKNFNVATQITHEIVIKRFLKFQSDHCRLAHEIKALTGHTPPQISDVVTSSGTYRHHGHRGPTTTDKYCHPTEEDLKSWLAREEELLKEKLVNNATKKVMAERRKHKEP